MVNWPTDRLTRGRTLVDEIFAIVFKAIDKRPVQPTEFERSHLVYGDTGPGSGNPDVDWDSILVAGNEDLSGLTDGRSNPWPTPATIVSDNNGNIVQSGA